MKAKYILLLWVIIFSNGCATIINGSKQSILVNTYPARAEVYNEGKKLGTTPTIIRIRRKSVSPLVISSEGYETKEVALTRKLNGATFINFINIYGYLIDWLTGANHLFIETSCVQSLHPEMEHKVVYQIHHLGNVAPIDSFIFWNLNKDLKYTDFQDTSIGKIKFFSAGTTSAISCAFELSDTAAKVRILSCFFKKNSFFFPKLKNPKEVLLHEQQHFNITEIVSRKIRSQIANMTFSSKTFEKELNTIVFESIQEGYKMQAEYDQEIYIGTATVFQKDKQKKWNKKVAAELDRLKNFADPDVLVNIKSI